MANREDPFAEIKAHFADVDDVVVNEGKGSQGLKYGKKMFTMFYKGQLAVKLSPGRVTELIRTAEGLPLDPGTGKPMKDRVIIPISAKERWIEFCVESKAYAQSVK